jgi:GT2 family glycosyltransferase
MPRVSVIIPTWNGADLLAVALASLERQCFRDFEVIVADNGSTDGTRELLALQHPRARCVGFRENRGFAAAVNAGIRAADGKIIVLMNNDTEADPGWLAALVRALDERPDVGFCASKMLRYDARTTVDSAGDKLGLLAHQIGHGEPDGPEFDEPRYVLSACAGAAAYRRDLFETVGLFDERYTSYLEDVDLGVRAQLRGFRCLYVPEAVIFHMGSATAKRMSAPKVYLLLRNSLFLFFQYMPAWVVLRWGAMMLVWTLAYAVREGQSAWVAIRALRDFFRVLPAVLRRRREIARTRRISTAEFTELLSPPLGLAGLRPPRVEGAAARGAAAYGP